MSKNEEGLSVVEGGALLVEHVVPKRGTFTLIMSDTMCYEVTESGRTLRLDFRPKTERGNKEIDSDFILCCLLGVSVNLCAPVM